MSNLNKRILTSIILLCFIFICIISNLFLIFGLFLISIVLFLEFKNISTNIFKNSKIKLFLVLTGIQIYLAIFVLSIYIFMNYNLNEFKIIFLSIIGICIATDIGGYVFGKIIGGKKISKISPNKTYSGIIGSYIFSLAFFYLIKMNINLSILNIYFVFLISTISQIGDFSISFLKRKAMIKDSGNFLPGHGGLLDRLDGMIFVIPLSLIFIFYFV